MAINPETVRAGEHILSEGNGDISRDKVIITGGDFPAGQVLGKLTANGKFTDHDPAAADGSQNAVAILYAPVDASAADANGVITARISEVSGDILTWKAGISAGDKTTGIDNLATKNIIVR